VPLDAVQQDVLAQALNEALEDGYRTYRISLSTPSPIEAHGDRLARLIDELVAEPPGSGDRPESPGSA
jgi:hypothetical protein